MALRWRKTGDGACGMRAAQRHGAPRGASSLRRPSNAMNRSGKSVAMLCSSGSAAAGFKRAGGASASNRRWRPAAHPLLNFVDLMVVSAYYSCAPGRRIGWKGDDNPVSSSGPRWAALREDEGEAWAEEAAGCAVGRVGLGLSPFYRLVARGSPRCACQDGCGGARRVRARLSAGPGWARRACSWAGRSGSGLIGIG